MKKVFRLPDVGEGIAEAEIVEYLVQVGDQVKADQPVVRIETDKAVVELPSPVAGMIAELKHQPGDTVAVGDPILVIETEAAGEKIEDAKASGEQTKEEERHEPLTPVPPSASDQETEPKEKKPPTKPAPPIEETAEAGPKKKETPGQILATPHTRKLARELGVDISKVKGTGSHGRITDEDIQSASKAPKPSAAKAPTAAAIQAPATAGFDFEKYGPTRREPLKGIRKATAEVMVRSVSTIPHVTHFDEADVTELLEVLKRKKPLAEKRGAKLTILSFVAKAAASALRMYPALNCSLDEETGELVYKDYYHLGFATDTDAGLMVPVIKDIDKKSVLQIAADLVDLSKRARERTIDIEEMRGGTFTITNVGALGGKWATPIIVHPQAAILCTLRAKPQPIVNDGAVVIRTVMPLTLSFDHRVLDGADAAKFMNFIVGLLEDPMRMLVDMS